MLERGEYISCANCGLPCYIGGVITDMDLRYLWLRGNLMGDFRFYEMKAGEEQSMAAGMTLCTAWGMERKEGD